MYDQACRESAQDKLLDLRVIFGGTAPGTLKDGGSILERVQEDLLRIVKIRPPASDH